MEGEGRVFTDQYLKSFLCASCSDLMHYALHCWPLSYTCFSFPFLCFPMWLFISPLLCNNADGFGRLQMSVWSWVFPAHHVQMLVLEPTTWLGFLWGSLFCLTCSTAVIGLVGATSFILFPPCRARGQKRGDSRSKEAGSDLQKMRI